MGVGVCGAFGGMRVLGNENDMLIYIMNLYRSNRI